MYVDEAGNLHYTNVLTDDPRGSNMPLVLIIIISIAGVAGVVFLIWRRKKKFSWNP